MEKVQVAIRYMRRTPKEQYGHEEVEISCAAEQGFVTQSLMALKTEAYTVLGIAMEPAQAPIEGREETEVTEEVVAQVPKAKKGRGKAKAAPIVEEEAEDDEDEEESVELVDEEDEGIEHGTGESKETDESDDDDFEVEEAPKPAKKKVKKAGTPYDRTNPLHRKLFGEILTRKFPKWKDNKEKVQTLSKSLHGKDFLDADGKTLPTFSELVFQGYKKK